VLVTTLIDFGSTEADWRHNTVRILNKDGTVIKELKYLHAYQDAGATKAVIDEDLSTLAKAQFDDGIKEYRGRLK